MTIQQIRIRILIHYQIYSVHVLLYSITELFGQGFLCVSLVEGS